VVFELKKAVRAQRQEIEVKFFMQDLGKVGTRLRELGARLLRPRVYELNLRYDRSDGSLRRQHRVLRLRQSDDIRLTYKGPGSIVDGAMSRQEIEFTVGDFEAAKAFLETLDYRIIVMYEKYRTAYEIETPGVSEDAGCLVMLDELPYGNFIEIERPDAASIHAAADSLSLKWETAITESYLMLFERLGKTRGLTFGEVRFANFMHLNITATDLGVCPAWD
jgi:predicted adenylyl cyclase CyaB